MGRKRITMADLAGVGLKDPAKANFVVEYSKDFDARRAAAVSGFAPDTGYSLRDQPEIQAALNKILQFRLETSHVDAEWLMWELVDNHQLARSNGNISASNTALNTLAKHAMIDAFAAERVEIASDEAIKERLMRARKRMNKDNNDKVSFL